MGRLHPKNHQVAYSPWLTPIFGSGSFFVPKTGTITLGSFLRLSTGLCTPRLAGGLWRGNNFRKSDLFYFLGVTLCVQRQPLFGDFLRFLLPSSWVFAKKRKKGHKKRPRSEDRGQLMIRGSQSPQYLSPILIGGIGLRSIISLVDSYHWASLRLSASWYVRHCLLVHSRPCQKTGFSSSCSTRRVKSRHHRKNRIYSLGIQRSQ